MFGRSFSGSALQRTLALVIALMLGIFPVLTSVATAQAVTPPVPAVSPLSAPASAPQVDGEATVTTGTADATSAPADTAAPPSWVASGVAGLPTGSRVDLSESTTMSTVFDLPDGSHVAMISQTPVRVRCDGAWRELNPTLVPDAGFGEYSPASTLTTITYASGDGSSDPVTIAGVHSTVGVAFIGSAQDEKLVLGDKVVYTNVATDTALEYQTLPNGFKETVLLASPLAPEEVRFSMSLGGLTPRRDASGTWGLWRAGAAQPEFTLGDLLVTDSSLDKKGDPAICPMPIMEINWVGDDACITCRIPRAWMDDPARVYPIKVDPTLTSTGSTASDTWVRSTASDDGISHASSTELIAGYYDSSTGHNRSIVRFDLSSIATSALVVSADLSLQQYWQYWEYKGQPTHLGRFLKKYANTVTWSGLGCKAGSPTAMAMPLETKTIAGRDVPVDFYSAATLGVVQDWIAHPSTNNGFMIYQLENSAENTDCWRRFRSSNYSPASEKPSLWVSYTLPATTVDVQTPKVVASGQSVVATVTLKTGATGGTCSVELAPNRVAGDASDYRGHFAWFPYAPSPADGWASRQLGTDSYIAYNMDPDEGGIDTSGTPRLALDMAACTAKVNKDVSIVVRFVMKPGPGLGAVRLDSMDTKSTAAQFGTDTVWTSGWASRDTSIDVLPAAAVGVTAATTASAGWFQEIDTNADGLNDARDDANTSGRGAINLNWQPSLDATGYAVYLWDGANYQKVATTTANSWSSSGAGLFPTDSQIALAPAQGTSAQNPFAWGGGLDLRDDPTPLYALKTTVTSQTIPAYYLKVAPISAVGEQPLSDAATLTVPVDSRTLHLSEDPVHTTVPLADMYGHAAVMRLDTGELTLDITDLSLPGIGLSTAVARHYSSLSTVASRFTPGWSFDFDRTVKMSGTFAVYTDASGDVHRFVNRSGTWLAPTGSTDKLIGSAAAGWTLTHLDRSKATFDGPTGRLTSVVDKNGNADTYKWDDFAGKVDIVGPNDTALSPRRIMVIFSSGKVTSATLMSGATTLIMVTYNAATGTVVFFDGKDAETRRTYRYDASGRLCDVIVPGFVPSDAGQADWNLSYRARGLTLSNITGAGTPSSASDLTWDLASRTATVTAGGVSRTMAWNPTGTLRSSGTVGASGSPWRYVYDRSGNMVRSASPTGRVNSAIFNLCSDMLSSTDEHGATTLYVYDDLDQMVSATGPSGMVAKYVWDARGNLLARTSTLDAAGHKAIDEWAYDAVDGRLLGRSTDANASESLETSYTDYDLSGKPKTVTLHSVKLASDKPGIELVARTTYDALGNELTSTDASGSLSSTTYDAAGRILTSADPSGTVSRVVYGLLGNPIESSTSAPGTSTILGWSKTTYNGLGAPVTRVAKASDGTTVSSTEYTYDSAGRQTRITDTLTPGAQVTEYDSFGRVALAWAAGTSLDTSATSTRYTYNAEDEVISQLAPGAVSSATVDALNAAGDVTRETAADGSADTFTYDARGNVTAITQPTDAGVASTIIERNLAGQITTVTTPAGVAMATTYDLMGRAVAVKQGGQPTSSVTYNTLGWVLAATDSDGTTTTLTYDAAGRVTRRSVAGLVTTYAYDACGRLISQSNPDKTSETDAYDCFGRAILSEQRGTDTAVAHRVRTSYDGAGRASVVKDEITGAVATYAYAANGSVTVASSRRAGASITTSTIDGAGQLTSTTMLAAGKTIDWALVATDTAGRVIDATSTALTADWRVAYDQAGRAVAVPSVAVTAPDNGPKVLSLACLVVDAPGVYGVLGSPIAPSNMLPTYTYDGTTGAKTGDNFHFDIAGGVDESNTYGYDVSSRLASATIAGTTTAYIYDDTSNALTAVKRGDDATLTLSYDASGHLTKMGTRTYVSDSLGRRTSASGGGTSDGTYSWTGLRLTGLKKATPASTTTYTYDADGQRTRSLISSGGVTTATNWDYSGVALQGLAATSSAGASYTIDYTYDQDGMVYAGIYRDSAATSAVAFQMRTTDRGDVRELDDASGATFGLYNYDAFGRPTGSVVASTSMISSSVASAIMSRQALRYASYVWDTETGLYYCSQRYYDPETMQFISKDPARADGEQSAYQYCGGNPVSQTDPSGLSAIWSENGGTSMDAAINAYRYSRNPKSRAYFLKRARAEAKREAVAQKRRDAARARARAEARAEAMSQIARSEAEAQSYAEEAGWWATAAQAATNVAAVCFSVAAICGAVIVAPTIASAAAGAGAWLTANGMGAVAGAGASGGALAALANGVADDGDQEVQVVQGVGEAASSVVQTAKDAGYALVGHGDAWKEAVSEIGDVVETYTGWDSSPGADYAANVSNNLGWIQSVINKGMNVISVSDPFNYDDAFDAAGRGLNPFGEESRALLDAGYTFLQNMAGKGGIFVAPGQ